MIRFVSVCMLLVGCEANVSMGAIPDSTSGGPDSDTAIDTGVGDSSAAIDTAPTMDTLAPPAPSSTVTGKWVGYIESYKLPSGSDALTIEVTELADGSAVGTVVFGTKSAPPPPTKPDTAYPADFVPPSFGGPNFWGEGFRYRMGAGHVSGNRVTLQVNSQELWKDWCELQTSYYDGMAFWECLPNWSSRGSYPGPCSQMDPMTSTWVPRDCVQLYLCSLMTLPCSCDAKGCTVASADKRSDIKFDVTVTGDAMNGSMTGDLGDKNVHLTRTM